MSVNYKSILINTLVYFISTYTLTIPKACTFRGMRREYFIHLASQTSLGLMYDDPNKVQEVENIIVDFYNRMTRGSFKRGLETPRCGFLLSCNFSLGKIQRCI